MHELSLMALPMPSPYHYYTTQYDNYVKNN